MLPSRPGRRVRATLLGLLATIWLMLSVQAARAQFTRFENLTDEQGLGNMTVTAFAQDSDGFILIGTEAGLFRYDGAFVTRADGGLPPGTWIHRIAVDGSGRVWVITDGGLYLRSGTQFRPVTTPANRLGRLQQVAFGDNELVFIRDGTLLRAAIRDGKLGPPVALSGGSPTVPASAVPAARFITATRHDGFLFGCGAGLCHLDRSGNVERFGTADGLPADTWDVAIRTADGALWARSLNRLAWRRAGERSFSTAAIPGRDQRFFTLVPDRLELVSDDHGGIITQGDDGLLRWDGTRWHPITHHDGGLAAAPIQALRTPFKTTLAERAGK